MASPPPPSSGPEADWLPVGIGGGILELGGGFLLPDSWHPGGAVEAISFEGSAGAGRPTLNESDFHRWDKSAATREQTEDSFNNNIVLVQLVTLICST